jgi:hypothetical protein
MWDLIKGILFSSDADDQEENLAPVLPEPNQGNMNSLSGSL